MLRTYVHALTASVAWVLPALICACDGHLAAVGPKDGARLDPEGESPNANEPGSTEGQADAVTATPSAKRGDDDAAATAEPDDAPNEATAPDDVAVANSDGDGSPGDASDEVVCTAERDALRGTAHAPLRRLSQQELSQTLRSLLGDIYEDSEIAPRVSGLPPDVARSAGDFAQSVPGALPSVLAQVAARAAPLLLSTPEARAGLAPCAEELPLSDDCVAEVVSRFGQRVWRRTLSESEVSSHLQLYAEVGGEERGLELVLRRLLQSPSLVFHMEAGTDAEPSDRLRLSDFEVASRIAYGLTDDMPDPELLRAAEDGQLSSLGDVQAHAQRLLNTPAARDKFSDFARYYAHLEDRADPSPALATSHGIDDVEGLADAMRQETLTFFDAVVWGEGTFADLMTRPWAFPRQQALAEVYGVELTDSDEPVLLESHPGLLHRPMMLLSAGKRTNPIVRGAHVRKQFLCTDLPLPPDADAVAAAQEQLQDSDLLDNRSAVAQATAGTACQGCHLLVNPVGFAFEGYDQMGVLRTEERILDGDGNVIATHPIDTAVDNPLLGTGGPDTVADSRELVTALAASPEAHQCMAQRLFEYYQRRVLDPEADACAHAEATARVIEGPLTEGLLGVVVNEDVFFRELADED